ncbi:MAG TPA: CAP domain-containing protein [Verrucomicrobiales bacterium]|jgi:hypothetical protein|nr:CAP domain-containing protein [Verrucomicrobiales bacterium]
MKPAPDHSIFRRILIFCLFPAGTGAVQAQTLYSGDGIPTPLEEEIRWHVNRARFDRTSENAARSTSYTDVPISAPPVAPNNSLTLAARHHSEDMAKKNKFQHETVPGSAYYNANTQPQPWDRFRAEGYVNFVAVSENIAAGQTTAEMAYIGWWNSTGHRVNLGSASYREIGNGYFFWQAASYDHYYTMDLGTRSDSFFTDTLFYDANGNGKYTQGEGVGGVRVSLRINGAEHAFYDIAAAPGSFAVPVTSITRGVTVEVWLTNTNGSAVTLSIPRSYQTLEAMPLAAGGSAIAGTISHPGSGVNFGFRNLTKATTVPVSVPPVTLTKSGSAVQVAWQSQSGLQYQAQWSGNLNAWTDFAGGFRNGTGGVMTQADTSTAAKRYYRLKVRRP